MGKAVVSSAQSKVSWYSLVISNSTMEMVAKAFMVALSMMRIFHVDTHKLEFSAWPIRAATATVHSFSSPFGVHLSSMGNTLPLGKSSTVWTLYVRLLKCRLTKMNGLEFQ